MQPALLQQTDAQHTGKHPAVQPLILSAVIFIKQGAAADKVTSEKDAHASAENVLYNRESLEPAADVKHTPASRRPSGGRCHHSHPRRVPDPSQRSG